MKKVLITVVVLVAIAGAVGANWWFRVVPPRVEKLYSQAVEQYSDGNFRGAADSLERAREWRPRGARINTLLGWSYWRLGDAARAEECFTRAYQSEPSSDDAKLGLAFASMALDHLSVALPLFRELNRSHPGDNEVRTALARAYSQTGDNLKAAQVYREWLDLDPSNQQAHRALVQLFGYPQDRPNLPVPPAAMSRPAELQLQFRAHGNYLQQLTNGEWHDIYPVGVNIGPARPGEFPSTASRDFAVYAQWFQEIAAMNANSIRVYTILPPAFYQALRAHNESAATPLWLIQEVWIKDDAEDLYDGETEKEFQRELVGTIDVVHGNGDVPYRRGHNFGIYTADVSPWVLAFAVGREVEPRLVINTNKNHPAQTHYEGKYVTLDNGSPTEAWFARMCDTAAKYEIDKYNAERPLTFVNWPPLDPMTHSTEANYVDEMAMRKKLGEVVPTEVPKEINDADAVSVDIAKFHAEPAFAAGLFALYHVYQHWPDFLLHEASYASARDSQGTNRYLGYLRELKAAYPNMPLLVGEYGIATSTASAHVHPDGWNNGGLSETQQAALLVRFTRNIRDSGYAGGIVFAWVDEWWKHVHDSFTAEFERPWDRNPLWLNRLDPEKQFGLVGYRAFSPMPLLRGNAADWKDAQQLYSAETSTSSAGHLRTLYATSDFAYLYVRLDVRPDALDWQQVNYWIALNTLPGHAGSKQLPGLGVHLDGGANFLVQLSSPGTAKILVAQNYNPNAAFAVAGRPGHSRIWRKHAMSLSLVDFAPFEDLVVEANPVRFGRDGTEFPAINYDRSPLPYGTADSSKPGFSSNAAWYVDAKKGMIELRIPWGLLLVSDPSQQQVFGGTDQQWQPQSRPSPGVSIAALEIAAGEQAAIASLPPLSKSRSINAPPVYAWKPWSSVEFEPYFKPAYFALQKVFGEFRGAAAGKTQRHGRTTQNRTANVSHLPPMTLAR